MKPPRPGATLSLDGRRVSAAEAALVRLRVSLGVGGAHDATELVVWPKSKLRDASPGASLVVALGAKGDEVVVWTGTVIGRSESAGAIVIEGIAGTELLSRRRVSRTYLGETAADIARDLAGEVRADEVEGDLALDAYSVDDRRPVWEHLRDLARLLGFDLGSTASGGLRFAAPKSGRPSLRFRHGADVIAWDLSASPIPVPPTRVEPWAGSTAGSSKWHWLRNDPVTDRPASPSSLVGAFRTRGAVEVMEKSEADRAARAAIRGTIRVVGTASVRPGDLIEAEGLRPTPNGPLPIDVPGLGAAEAFPGPLRVLAVEHGFDSRLGFTSDLTVEGGGGSKSGGLLGGLAGAVGR